MRKFLNLTVYGSSLSMVSSCSNAFFANIKISISLMSAHIPAVMIANPKDVFCERIKSIAVADDEVNP